PWVLAQDQFGAQTTDADQRAEVYYALARHVAWQLSIVPLFLLPDVALVKPRLCYVKKWPMLGENLWNIADWHIATTPSCPWRGRQEGARSPLSAGTFSAAYVSGAGRLDRPNGYEAPGQIQPADEGETRELTFAEWCAILSAALGLQGALLSGA